MLLGFSIYESDGASSPILTTVAGACVMMTASSMLAAATATYIEKSSALVFENSYLYTHRSILSMVSPFSYGGYASEAAYKSLTCIPTYM